MHSFVFNTLQVSLSGTWLTVAEHRGNDDLHLLNNGDYYIHLARNNNNTMTRLPLISFLHAWNEYPNPVVKLKCKNITFNKNKKIT
jgi:hypothetical protein